jgi:TldD protein
MYDKVVKAAQKLDLDDFNLRIGEVWGNSLEFKDRSLEKAYSGTEIGASIRLLRKGCWGFYSANDVSEKSLLKCLDRAYRMAKLSHGHVDKKVEILPIDFTPASGAIRGKTDLRDIDIRRKKKLALEVAKAALAVKGVHTVTTSYSDGISKRTVIDIDGDAREGEVPRTLLGSQITVREGAKVVSFRTRVGGTRGWEMYTIEDPVKKMVVGAKSALRLLNAGKAPSGRLPLVADPALTGVFVHEAVGHACESDIVISGESVLEGRIGERIAAPNVTIIDDSTVKGAFGSLVFDDEGARAQKRVLIENGVLKTFLLSRETAKKLGMEPNGSARAESVGARPLVRMSNTLMQPGDRKKEELFEGIKRGVYALGTRGGQVDTAKGSFQFNAQEAFLIEKGEVTKPLRDVSISGTILETMKGIVGMGKKRYMGEPGFCGKGQMVPVGDGGPYTRIKSIIIGGG